MTAPTTALRGRTRARASAGAPPKTLRRETHQPDYVILVAVIAMSAIGILMVFSSSAMKEFARDGDVFGAVAPQVAWGVAGLLTMLGVMRVDYRRLRLVSIPLYAIAVVLLVLVFDPHLGQTVGGSSRWLKVGPLPAVHPAEFAKLAMVIYLAHWLTKRGDRVGGLLTGTLPFLVVFLPIVVLVLREPDLGTSMVLATTGLTMFLLAGASLLHFVALLGVGFVGIVMFALRGYQLERIRAWLDPWGDPAGIGFHSVQGLMALGSGGLFGLGLGQSRGAGGLFLPNASNDFIFAVIGEEFGLLGAGLVVTLFVILAYQGLRVALAAPDTFGSLLAAGITTWLCVQAFINIGVVVALFPITGITLPFISAGGSSLTISLAAVGILLSISRETVERGTWNDASADRGRGHRRAHLPGSGRRPVAARQRP
ncbi:MAG: putative lipid II flippase FtsW [Chloroflexota bacterium]|nr:putative lipid II flippase FtsW [Chloroflexota bacterium]